MGFWSDDERSLQARYHDKSAKNGGKPLGPHDDAEMERRIRIYAQENNMSFTDAYIVAKTGKKPK